MLDVWIPLASLADPNALRSPESPAAMTHVKSHDGISPHQNLSDERGLAEQVMNGLDRIERHDDDEDNEESEKCGDFQSEDEDDAAPEAVQDNNEPVT